MERLLVLEQYADDHLMLVTRVVTSLNENQIESLIVIILGSYLLVIIINGLEKMLFSQMNLFQHKKNPSFVCRLPSEADVPFNF